MAELTQEDRVALARIVTNMLDEWGIKASDQVNILALPEGTPTRMLRRYQDDTPLPDDPDVLKQVEHLMGIADALRTTFPRNASLRFRTYNAVTTRANTAPDTTPPAKHSHLTGKAQFVPGRAFAGRLTLGSAWAAWTAWGRDVGLLTGIGSEGGFTSAAGLTGRGASNRGFDRALSSSSFSRPLALLASISILFFANALPHPPWL